MTIKSINGIDVLNTSELAMLLGISVTVSQLRDVGIEPFATSPTATLWKRSDAAIAAINIADKLITISEQIEKEYKK